ncbi:MAG: metallophosphoesterase [Lachnospiraceae bacterium]|nr:metallophosphoesterase [Lachnospiraceae bacterium]
MSTYVISDIHGSLDAFVILLSSIGFNPATGVDVLYLLGDYADWGTRSIETIGYVMDLDLSPHVHCLIGNHDLMFLQAIEADKKMAFPSMIWYETNRGFKTWDDYKKLSGSNKMAIYDWLVSLAFSVDIKVGTRL